MATNKPASSRRGPSESAKRRSEAICAPAVSFPINGPKIPEIGPGDCVARVTEASAEGVRIVVLPREAVVRHMLNQVYGSMGWGDTYYRSGSWWRCQIEVLSPVTGLYVRKDAGPLELNQRAPFTAREALFMGSRSNALSRLLRNLEELHGRLMLESDKILEIAEAEK